mgnify:CR=1 FL=1
MSRPSKRELERALEEITADGSAASITEFVEELLTDGFDVGLGGGAPSVDSVLLVEDDDYSIHVGADRLPEWIDIDALPVMK